MQTHPSVRSSRAPLQQSLARIDENLWEANAPLKAPGLRIDHRMTVVRLNSGELVVHSPVEYSAALRDAILGLGTPKWFIAPSRYHDLYWPQWFGAFPQARFVATPGMSEERPELPFSDVLSEGSKFWDGELVPMAIRGMPRINEFALLHLASRTLIIADLVFNIDADAQSALGKLFLRLNGIYRKPGISRIFRTQIKDRSAFRESLQEIVACDYGRMIIGHGANVGGRPILEQAAKSAGII